MRFYVDNEKPINQILERRWMSSLNYLNLGCGSKFHKEWVNVDMASTSKYVKAHNLLKGLPFPDNKFDVVYHSQVLEHFSKETAGQFIDECFRVLKPGGIIRIVVPDLENIVTEYLKYMHENIRKPCAESEANYDWLLLEMYDQAVRNHGGGQMAKYLRQDTIINEQYIYRRIGYQAKSLRNTTMCGATKTNSVFTNFSRVKNIGLKNVVMYMIQRLKFIFSSKAKRIGMFRLGGEVHMWMYDRFSLSRLLKAHGFEKAEVLTPFKSNIELWANYQLDVKDGEAFDPSSLFMEAVKPSKRKQNESSSYIVF